MHLATRHKHSPISTLCGATLATAGDPCSPLPLLSLRAALAAIPRHGLLVSRPALSLLPVSALISELYGMGRLISLLEKWRSGVVLPSPSVWMSFSLTDFFCNRLLISMMLPMISTGPVRVFLRGEKSSLTFFKGRFLPKQPQQHHASLKETRCWGLIASPLSRSAGSPKTQTGKKIQVYRQEQRRLLSQSSLSENGREEHRLEAKVKHSLPALCWGSSGRRAARQPAARFAKHLNPPLTGRRRANEAQLNREQ
ncbi:hypothetical protein EYF80_011914 [Liparis tanakae]|uniref:Uncharacterized protein n=1 Tax=Liparis tanakae TaxID=230148 RepID=A0A4Z2IJ81_9TELE|nr:hypothetical protein EYF80_011914 [Liparis tanakae]